MKTSSKYDGVGRVLAVGALSVLAITACHCRDFTPETPRGMPAVPASPFKYPPGFDCQLKAWSLEEQGEPSSLLAARAWSAALAQSTANLIRGCVQVVRSRPGDDADAAIPSLAEVRNLVRRLTAEIIGDAAIPYDVLPDGCHVRAHLIAGHVRKHGWNVEKLFAAGSLVPRDESGALFKRGLVFAGPANASDKHQTWGYHVAPVVIVRLPSDSPTEPGGFDCPMGGGHCAVRVIDPALRPKRNTAGADDNTLGLLTVSQWVGSILPMPAATGKKQPGVGLEVGRWQQYYPRITIGGAPESAIDDVCSPELLKKLQAMRVAHAREKGYVYRVWRSVRVTSIEINPNNPLLGGHVSVSAHPEILSASGTLLQDLQRAYKNGDLVDLRVEKESLEVRRVDTKASGAAPRTRANFCDRVLEEATMLE